MTEPIARRRRRALDRLVLGHASARTRQALHQAMAADPVLRSAYDQRVEAMRVLEGTAISELEIDAVEARLLGPPARATTRRRRWTLLGTGLAMAAAVVLLLVVRPESDLDSAFGVRGQGASGHFAIQVLCTPPKAEPRPASEGPCPLDGVISFAHRVDGSAPSEANQVTLFGVTDEGRVLYYAPTPDHSAISATRRDRWTASHVSVSIAVNHPRGRVRVYGLLSPVAPGLETIDTWAASLAPSLPASPETSSWTDWVDPDSLQAICPRHADCEAAETSFVTTRTYP